MGDLFLHVPFARRLRYAEGLHPLAREALVRKSPQLALASALADLPAASTKAGGLFSRLFKRGKGEAQKWGDRLAPAVEPRGDLVHAMLLGGQGAVPGPLTRLSLGLGVLAHELLASELAPLYEGLDASMKSAVERGQARLWLQFAVPSRRDLEHEWAPALAFHELESHRALIAHIDGALSRALGEAPGRDALNKWAKSLFTEVSPLLEKGGMPEAGAIADHAVKARYYEGDAGFLDHIQNVTTRFVFLAGRVAACFLGDDPDPDTLRGALMTDDGKVRGAPGSDELAAAQTRWKTSVGEVRAETLTRGRNPKAAFDGEGILDNLPDLPPLPADAEDSVSSPTVTQEVSLAQIEAEMRGNSDEGEPVAGPPPVPTSTQQISAADIEAEAGTGSAAPPPPPDTSGEGEAVDPPAAPTSTQQISAADIESELGEGPAATPPPPPATSGEGEPVVSAPTTTQQISALDIQAELADVPGSGAPTSSGAVPPPAPTSTQQISALDIQAELSANVPPPPPESSESMPRASAAPPPTPTHTQQISAVDIEAEVIAEAGSGAHHAPPPPAPTSTQQISALDIQAELSSADPMAPPPHTQQVVASDIEAASAQPPATPPTNPGAVDPPAPAASAPTAPAAEPAAEPAASASAETPAAAAPAAAAPVPPPANGQAGADGHAGASHAGTDDEEAQKDASSSTPPQAAMAEPPPTEG